MIDEGWIEEAKLLFEQGLLTSPTAKQAIGYSLIHDYLYPQEREANQIHLNIPTEKILIERIVTKTAQYAKQQRAWFKRKHADATFITMDDYSKSEVVELIKGDFNGS